MSAGQYIDNYNKKESKEKFMNEWQIIKSLLNDLTYFCDNYYAEESKNSYNNHINDEITYENFKNKPCNPCGCRSSDAIKETIYDDLDKKRNDFLDKFDDLSACEKTLIYKYTEFIKNLLLI